MEGSRFDQLARGLASRRSRRSIVKTAVAAAVTAVAGWNTAAAKKGGGSGGSTCADDPTICTGGLVCCPSGNGGRCMSLDKCHGDPICPTGEQFCATTGACAECCIDSDCPARANETASCQQGVCQTTCNAGFADCNANVTDGCEVNLNTDANNCGACGNVCGTYEVCRNGACASPCEPGMQIECSYDPQIVRCGDIYACGTTMDNHAVCVQYGSFSAGCGTPCETDADCAGLAGYVCVQYSCPDCTGDPLCCTGGRTGQCEYPHTV